MNSRSGLYAGCAWLVLAALLAVGAYWGLGIAGPSGLPAVVVLLLVAAISVVLAVALFAGIGGRKVAVLSLVLGVVVLAIGLLSGDAPFSSSNIGTAMFGLAIVLGSTFAIYARRLTD